MLAVDALYDWLAAGPTPDCDRIVAAALALAEPAYFQRLCELLRQRGHTASRAALLSAWPRLPEGWQRELTSDRELLRKAVADALRWAPADGRAFALDRIVADAGPDNADVLTDALRDPAPAVRELAARGLYELTARCLTAWGAVPSRTPPAALPDRARLARTLSEAVRTFELHRRPEPIHAALWLARDLGPGLWETLSPRRSRCRDVVTASLRQWDDPRLAGFYLLALRDPEWIEPVERLLALWRTREHVAALLDQTDLLDSPAVRTALARMRPPRWFEEVDRFALDLTAAQRAALPRWVLAAALSDGVRIGLLSRWMHRPCPRLRRAALYALAALNTPETAAQMRAVAVGDDALATFARWWRAGHELQLPHTQAASRATLGAAQPPRSDVEFMLLWEIARRTEPHRCTLLLPLLRAHVDLWRAPLLARLTGNEPHDRLLALQVLATEELATYFREELQKLLHDPVTSIRTLARNVMQQVARLAAAAGGFLPSRLPAHLIATAVRSAASLEEVRSELLRFLTSLVATDGPLPITIETVAELGERLDQFRAALAAPTFTTAEFTPWER